MNHPVADPLAEIRWMAELKLDFVDLTLEPPAAASWRIDPRAIRKELDGNGLKVVGHTAYYLPFCSPFEALRRASVDEIKACLEKFAIIGAKWVNLHPDRHAPMHDRRFIIERNLETLHDLLPTARACGVGLMIENLPGDFNTVEQLGELLDPIPDIGLHLDIGHSNLMVRYNSASEIVQKYGKRLKHVHLHDNKGGAADLHLPLGTGNVDVPGELRMLKRSGYNETITLEVFAPDRHYLAYSRDIVRKLWNSV
jgi:sugar phosphate isomerase/epimerase